MMTAVHVCDHSLSLFIGIRQQILQQMKAIGIVSEASQQVRFQLASLWSYL
jgi:hypothetical protein